MNPSDATALGAIAGTGSLTSLAALTPLAVFMFVASITPGPNNVMLATAGAVAGFRATLPHLFGISVGHAVQIVLIGLGIGSLFATAPWLVGVLRFASAAYLLWLAWSLARAALPEPGQTPRAGQPLSFVGAALFQWVNPKAWMMALTVCSAFLDVGADGANSLRSLLLVALVSMLVNFPCVAVWAAAGVALRRWLTVPRRWLAFNWTMAAALVATAASVIV